MLKKSDCCVIIPAYNEEAKIAQLAEEVKSLGFFLLVINDGSTDRTEEILKKNLVFYLTEWPNQGKGTALRLGFNWAIPRTFKAIMMMDSDGQHDPKDLERFLNTFNDTGADFLIGNRMTNPEGMPALRVHTNRFMSGMLSRFAKVDVPDSQCGYRAIRAAALSRMNLKTAHFEIESEMLLEAGRLGLKIASVPIHSRYEGRRSHINPVRDTIRFVKFLANYRKKTG